MASNFIEWPLLQDVYYEARKASVSFSAVYCECDDSWYFTVDSPAPTERFIGKNHAFQYAVEAVLKHLRRLNGTQNSNVFDGPLHP